MKLSKFLESVNGSESDIKKTLTGKDALSAVKQYGDALQYVDKSIFEPDGNVKTRKTCSYCNVTGTVTE